MGRIERAPDPATSALSDQGAFSVSGLRENIEEWAAGRSALVRLPLLAYLISVLINQLEDPDYGSLLFGGITFLIHELGHVVFSFAPDFVTIAAGSAAQLLVPAIVAWVFLKQPDYFGVTIGGYWLGYSLINLSRYIGDARKKILILFGVGAGEPIHDWEYMLSRLGLLESDRAIASFVRTGGAVISIASILAAAWICLLMWQLRGTRRRSFS